MKKTKSFHLGDILSIVTGRLISPSGMKGIYNILSYMKGVNLYTHQLPAARDECKPRILEQYPQLANVDASMVNPKNHEKWLSEQVEKFGEKLPIK
jgi:hypothetical protein